MGLGDSRNRDTFTRVELFEPVARVDAGGEHTALITESGQLWVCGANNDGELDLGDYNLRDVFTWVDLPEPVSQVAPGLRHTALITESGQLWVCGDNRQGQLGLGNNEPPISSR